MAEYSQISPVFVSQIDSQNQIRTSTPVSSPAPGVHVQLTQGRVVKECQELLCSLQPNNWTFCVGFRIELSISYFIERVPSGAIMVRGTKHLNECGRSNVKRSFVQVLGTMRPNQSESL